MSYPRSLPRSFPWIVAVLSVLVALASYRFLALDLHLAFADLATHIDNRRLAFLLHISASPVALAAGSLQFFPGLRAKRPLHRWLGRLYGLAIVAGGASGLILAINAPGGGAAQLGFGLLSVLWIGVTARAIYLAMQGKIGLHRRWMIRSFALTFAGVTLRLYLAGAMGFGIGYIQASSVLVWLCWVPNLVLVEWWLRRGNKR